MKNIVMKNIALTGFMGTGKTEAAKELAKILGWKAVEIDSEIEISQGMTITEIFRKFGESRFREIETETINRFTDHKNIIFSTGGGAVLKKENITALRKNGIIACLTALPETILKRIGKNDERPLLQVEDPLTKIKELLDFRKPYYEDADIIVDTEGKTPPEIANEIIARVKEML